LCARGHGFNTRLRQGFLCLIFFVLKKTQKHSFSKCLLRHEVLSFFCVVLFVSFCTGHFVMVPLNLTYLHCLQHSLFEHLFNLYYFCCVFTYCPTTHYLSQNFAIPFAMLIYIVYLTYCKICDQFKGYKDTDLASLSLLKGNINSLTVVPIRTITVYLLWDYT